MPILAIAGGTSWIAKSLVILGNGGAGATEGAAAVLFLGGFGALAIAAAGAAWALARRRRMPVRAATAVGSVAALFLAVNLPILLGQAIMPGSWLAEELGVIAVALGAVVGGVRSLRPGAG